MSVGVEKRRFTISSTSASTQQQASTHHIPLEHIDADALKVVRRLERHDKIAYLVGGCVRDLLLGRTPKDFDIGTSARPRQVKELFRNSRIIGRRFRLAHIVFGRKVIEVATFRATQEPPELPEPVDGEDRASGPGEVARPDYGGDEPTTGDGARADLLIRSDNVFGTAEQDAFRRDFTVNALFYDPDNARVIDYVGGLADLERRVLRTIGDPDVRFREDPVRIVRAVKFAARLHFAIEPKTFDAMIRQRGELTKAAPPRLAEEVVRLAQGGSGAESFRLMQDLGILQYIAPLVSKALERATARGSADAGAQGLFWKTLEAIDRWPRGPGDLSRATVLSAVYGPVWREAMETNPQAQRDPGAAFFNAIRPAISDRLISRREADRIKLILITQRRLESAPHPGDVAEAKAQMAQGGPPQTQQGGGRRRRRRRGGAKGLVGRDYFREAVAYFRLESAARGRSPDVWTQWESLIEQAPPTREVLPFRRRAEEALAATNAELPDDEPPPTPEEIEALNRIPDDEDFGRHRRRRGGRLSENARERERVQRADHAGAPRRDPDQTDRAQPAVPAPPPVSAEWLKTDIAGAPEGPALWSSLPKLKRPMRPRDLAAPPAPIAAAAIPATPPPPPAPRLSAAERVGRAMASETPLINPYTNRPYVPRKVFDEMPAPRLAPPPASETSVDAGGGVVTTPTYTLDEFERPSKDREPITPPSGTPVVAEKTSKPATPAEGAPQAAAPSQAQPGQPGQPGSGKRRRRRGRRGRGRGRGGAPNGGGNAGGGSTPPAA